MEIDLIKKKKVGIKPYKLRKSGLSDPRPDLNDQ
jgi:hypothetical protein